VASPTDAALAATLERHLGLVAQVRNLHRLSGGASRETWSFDAVTPGVGNKDGDTQALVLRRDPSAVAGAGARATEYELLRAAASAGVRAPEVVLLLDDDDELGHGFVMRRVEGETIPRRILRDPELADARAGLAAECGRQAARIHAVPRATLPELPVLDASAQIEQFRHVLTGLGDPHPAFELGLRLLERTAPVTHEPRLVHGDFRNGNLVVGPDGLRAVLDWELAHLGDPVEDLGWCCVRSWRFGEVDRPVGGFGDVATLLAAYHEAGGGPVDAERLAWWEAFGTLKWGLICGIQAQTHLGGLVRSVELATLGRRMAEMEWDLLLLLVPDAIARVPASPEPEAHQQVNQPVTFQDRPTPAELLEAVREFVDDDARPGLDGRAAFHARVAVNALAIVERELVLGPAVEAPVADRLSTLLGRSGTARELAVALATGIREGTIDDTPEVVEAIVALVRAKLTIANPRYAGT
jgi:aminoglycoside phosphotransferase (APT) family kinase protein